MALKKCAGCKKKRKTITLVQFPFPLCKKCFDETFEFSDAKKKVKP